MQHSNSNQFVANESFNNHHFNNQHQPSHVESNLIRNHNNKSIFNKKHVKFAKTSKVSDSSSGGASRKFTKPSSSLIQSKNFSKKSKKVASKDNFVSTLMPVDMEAAGNQPFYYYYYYPEETLPAMTNEDQQAYFTNQQYYCAIECVPGTDFNYQPEYFVSTDNCMRWFDDIQTEPYYCAYF